MIRARENLSRRAQGRASRRLPRSLRRAILCFELFENSLLRRSSTIFLHKEQRALSNVLLHEKLVLLGDISRRWARHPPQNNERPRGDGKHAMIPHLQKHQVENGLPVATTRIASARPSDSRQKPRLGRVAVNQLSTGELKVSCRPCRCP